MNEEKEYTIDEAHHYFGVEFNNRIFAIAEKESFNEEDKIELLSCAYAAFLHWQKFSGHQAVNTQRSLYMLAKAHVLVEDKIKALEYAQQCLAFTQKNLTDMQDFDVAYSHEMMARAAALNGDKVSFKKHYKLVKDMIPRIAKDGDRKWLQEDVKGGNWFGIL